MKRLLLSWLLHHANRGDEYRGPFYRIKDQILTRYGKQVGYDIQHIPGKRCRSCGGKGYHTRYSMYWPYSAYDWPDCWHCIAGWYKLPQWNCLARIQFGKYTFHKPLKREYRINNPWTEDEMGLVEGYIEHRSTWFSDWAILLLFSVYDRPMYAAVKADLVRWMKYRLREKVRRFKAIFRLSKPTKPAQIRQQYSYSENKDLPF